RVGRPNHQQTLAKTKLSSDAAATVGVLLFWSRAQESEADHLGLIRMVKADYDSHAAVAAAPMG
ncbi:MAG TPA: M48 family metalloprotease, partial [Thermoanaerobaculia bacterium]|nr:M48 family metalloprotease [Thermoanaerobaculia bacterium]